MLLFKCCYVQGFGGYVCFLCFLDGFVFLCMLLLYVLFDCNVLICCCGFTVGFWMFGCAVGFAFDFTV